MRACLDTPVAGQLCDPFCLRIEGWSLGVYPEVQLTAVEVWDSSRCVGRTALWFARPDVTLAFNLQPEIRPGFAVGVVLPSMPASSQLKLRLDFFCGEKRVGTLDASFPISRDVTLPSDPRIESFEHTAELVDLISRTLGPFPTRLVELACERGLHGRSLCERGYFWHGLTDNSRDSEILSATGLPHTVVDGVRTPFRDAGFDVALILAGKAEPLTSSAQINELKRIAPDMLLASVARAATPFFSSGKSDADDARLREELYEALHPFFTRIEFLPYAAAKGSELTLPPRYTRWFVCARR